MSVDALEEVQATQGLALGNQVHSPRAHSACERLGRDPHPLEDFEGVGVHDFGVAILRRMALRAFSLIQNPTRNAPFGEFDRHRQAGGSGAYDQNRNSLLVVHGILGVRGPPARRNGRR